MESLEKFEQRYAEVDALREANRRLSKELRIQKARTEELVRASLIGAKDAMIALGGIKSVVMPKLPKGSIGDPEVAMWVLGDWQLGKLTANYDTEVCKERVMRFCDKAIKITKQQRASRPIEQCVIAFGGDMIEGACFQFSTQPHEIDSTIFAQYVAASRLMIEVVRKALATYETVEVVSEYGNHGRMGSKRDALPRSDNIDRMSFHLAMELLAEEPRLEWHDGVEDVQRIEIGNYRALLMHGDEIGRGGFASPMTIVRHADRWRSGAYPWDFVDLYVHHYHQHQEWGMANGRGHVFMTGSTESENRYARDTMSASAVPSQRLHFVDPERGRVTSGYQIYVDE